MKTIILIYVFICTFIISFIIICGGFLYLKDLVCWLRKTATEIGKNYNKYTNAIFRKYNWKGKK